MPSDWKDALFTLGAGVLTALIGGRSPALEVLVFVGGVAIKYRPTSNWAVAYI